MRTTLAMLIASLSLSTSAAELAQRTLLDDYVEQADDSHAWRIAATKEVDGTRIIVVDMVSQHWLTEAEVDRTEWRHWLRLSIPPTVTTDIGFLYITGGQNTDAVPEVLDPGMIAIANATGSVVAELGMVPNQPLVFDGDGVPRGEDDLIAYNWAQSLKGDGRRLALDAMTKSALRAMDTVSAVLATPEGGEHRVERFVVSGGSKRGWTTWLVGAVDDRVVGIVPIVFDALNSEASMRHHFASYGYFSPTVGDYVLHGILPRLGEPAVSELMRSVDPYQYRHRVTVPKLVLNATGDEFFLPDSSRFYWNELRGENYLRYVPNSPHSMGGTDVLDTVAAFHWLTVNDRRPPRLSWIQIDGALHVMASDQPESVLLWQATNPAARDFRLAILGPAFTSTPVEADERGMYTARVSAPERGWTAWFLELTYEVGAPKPLKLTTEVVITPDVLPYVDKPLNLPTSITVVCSATDPATVRDAVLGATEEELDIDKTTTEIVGDRLYVNWTPGGDMRASATAVGKFLEGEGCANGYFQLESGVGMTLPPVR
ncbi:MAG: PhoPQ-activated protein PqaA family protein [Gammaproteobacteria bacterium]|nr:PhoPQ-activated protein PqaA family protein [Gammaproteobacteria bacterium]